jgi:hypothetical protein
MEPQTHNTQNTKLHFDPLIIILYKESLFDQIG